MRIRASVNGVILPASNSAEQRYIEVERPTSVLFMSKYFHPPGPDEMSIHGKEGRPPLAVYSWSLGGLDGRLRGAAKP
jgi:hypothetical protein